MIVPPLIAKTLGATGLALWVFLALIIWWARYQYLAQYGWEDGPTWREFFDLVPVGGAALSGLALRQARRQRTWLACLIAGPSLLIAGALVLICIFMPVDA